MLRLSGSVRRHPLQLAHGKFPSVSVNNNGTIVEVCQRHILSNEIYYRVGELNGEETDMSRDEIFLDKGRYPKVAINDNNRVVEVHEGRVHRCIYYHVGTIDVANKTINWHGRVYSLCQGRLPAVAVHGDRVVVTYDRAYGSYTSYYCIGNFNEDGTDIQWAEEDANNRKLFSLHGIAETSVSINEQNIIVAGRGWNNIICRVGRFQGNAIHFTTEIPFDHLGYCPSVCLDIDGYIVMIWQSFTLRKLNYVTGNIQNPQDPTITWPRQAPLTSYGYGYNPTIAISSDGTKVLEEHETNYANLGRCTLYYHTGILEKPPRQGQAPQPQEGQAPQEEQQPLRGQAPQEGHVQVLGQAP